LQNSLREEIDRLIKCGKAGVQPALPWSCLGGIREKSAVVRPSEAALGDPGPVFCSLFVSIDRGDGL